MDRSRRFSVTLHIAQCASTGESYSLPTDAEIAEDDAAGLAAFDAAMESMLSAEDEADVEDRRLGFVAQRRLFVARQDAASANLRRVREGVGRSHLATRHKFTLIRPTFGEWQHIVHEARQPPEGFDWRLSGRGNLDANGNSYWNEGEYRALLLKAGGVEQNGRVLSEDDVDALPVVIAEELGRRLAASLEVGEEELTYHSAAACSHLIKGMHPMPPEKMSYEAQVFLAWQTTGTLPFGSIYEADARLALVLSELSKDTNGGGTGEAGGNGGSDAPANFPGM